MKKHRHRSTQSTKNRLKIEIKKERKERLKQSLKRDLFEKKRKKKLYKDRIKKIQLQIKELDSSTLQNKLKEYKQKLFNIDKETMKDKESKKQQFHGKNAEIMIRVPNRVKKTADYAYKLKALGFKGGLETGWKRAHQLSTKEYISIQDLRYIRNFFARHIITSYPSYKEWIDAGRPKDKSWHNKRGIIAWIIWGGDAGFKWINSEKNIEALNKKFNKNYLKIQKVHF